MQICKIAILIVKSQKFYHPSLQCKLTCYFSLLLIHLSTRLKNLGVTHSFYIVRDILIRL